MVMVVMACHPCQTVAQACYTDAHQVHLSAGVAEAHVRIYGGDIDLVVSPDARLHIHVSDADGMLLDGNFVHATVSSKYVLISNLMHELLFFAFIKH
jgi:hypothetical protein